MRWDKVKIKVFGSESSAELRSKVVEVKDEINLLYLNLYK